ncbi:hypothetical protein, partial [Escherichia coli]|uniref:hypothetical protein n=1 Tax=Escherichia coli TaxID=562 RepID=UPI001BC8C27E
RLPTVKPKPRLLSLVDSLAKPAASLSPLKVVCNNITRQSMVVSDIFAVGYDSFMYYFWLM